MPKDIFQFLMVRGGRGGREVFKVCVQDRIGGAEHVDIPVPHGRDGGGGLQGFLPRQFSSASSSHSPGAADEALHGFSHFSHMKKVRGWVRTWGRN